MSLDDKQDQFFNGNPATYEPEPLRAPLPTAETYPVEALGDVLGKAAKALQETVKAPMALCCQAVLASASLAAQAHFDVMLPWGQTKPLSLFLLSVAESGERKSGIDDVVLGAAKTQEREDMAGYQIDQEQYEADLARWKAESEAQNKKSAIKIQAASDFAAAETHDNPKPKAPIMPLRFVTEPTVEGLYKLLAVGQPSVGLYSDEAGLLIGGHAMNSDNALKTMARLCKFWDGASFDRVRAGDGSGSLYGRRLAMHQQAQPDVMAKLLCDPMANGQGFLARCLVAWPESTIGTRYIDKLEWSGDRKELKRLFAVLIGLMQAEPRTAMSEQELDPVALPLDDDAKLMAIEAMNQFETLMQSGNDLFEIRERTAKAVENACRIAGVLAVIDDGMATRSISAKHLAQGLTLIQWYLKEALRIRGAAVISQAVKDAESLSKWLDEQGLRVFRSKQVQTLGPSQLRPKPRFQAAVKELVDNGYLLLNEPNTTVDNVKARLSWRVIHVV